MQQNPFEGFNPSILTLSYFTSAGACEQLLAVPTELAGSHRQGIQWTSIGPGLRWIRWSQAANFMDEDAMLFA
jgi:hypothetical protein